MAQLLTFNLRRFDWFRLVQRQNAKPWEGGHRAPEHEGGPLAPGISGPHGREQGNGGGMPVGTARGGARAPV